MQESKAFHLDGGAFGCNPYCKWPCPSAVWGSGALWACLSGGNLPLYFISRAISFSVDSENWRPHFGLFKLLLFLGVKNLGVKCVFLPLVCDCR